MMSLASCMHPPHPTRLTLRVQVLLSPFPRQGLGTQRPARWQSGLVGSSPLKPSPLPCSRCSGHGHVTTHLPQTLHVARLLLPGLLGSCARCSLFLLEAAWVGRGGKQLGEWSGKCSSCRKGLRESACCVSGCAPWTRGASVGLASSGPLPADSVSVCE